LMFFSRKYKFFYSLTLAFFLLSLFPNRLWAESADNPSTVVAATPVLRAIRLDPKDPFHMEFIFDSPRGLSREKVSRTVEYFLAALTIPESDLWVNLSPYEQDRVMDDHLVKTHFGESLLKEDYLLKQLAASLTNPETEAGKRYWREINNYNRSLSEPRPSIHPANRRDTQGAACIEMTQSFNKVWIVPAGARVKENGYAAYIEHSALQVLTEEDYLARERNGDGSHFSGARNGAEKRTVPVSDTNNSIDSFRKHILPLINKEVNEGESFAQLRQMYNAFVLATWFKRKVKESIFKDYIGNDKVSGIDRADKAIKEKIYASYLEAFKKGAYNYVKKEYVRANNYSPLQKIAKHHYFSGGIELDERDIKIIRDFNVEEYLSQLTISGRISDIYYWYAQAGAYNYLDSPTAYQSFYGVGDDHPAIASYYQAHDEAESGLRKRRWENITLGRSQEQDIPPGIHLFKRREFPVDVKVSIRYADESWPLERDELFFAAYRNGHGHIIMRRDNPLNGRIEPGAMASELAEAAETIYWQSRISHEKWEDNFAVRYDPQDISLPELLRIKALARIVAAYGRDGLTPLQKKYLAMIAKSPDRARHIRTLMRDLDECFFDRREAIIKYLGSEGRDLLDYIAHRYLPRLQMLAREDEADDGGVKIGSQNIAVNGADGLVFNIPAEIMAGFKQSAGINFWVGFSPPKQ